MDRYLGMINDTEKDWQCSRHREIEHGCHMYGMNYQQSGVNMFKNRIDKYLVNAGYT